MIKHELLMDIKTQIDGLHFRKFAGEQDYPIMLEILERASQADQEEHAFTLEAIKHDYAHLTNSKPEEDMIFAEIHGKAIAYSRVQWWQEEKPNDRIYTHFVNIVPQWRNQGIEIAMIQWCETRLHTIAADQPEDSQRFFQTYSSAFKPEFNKILENQGYNPARFFIEMSRPLDDIPTADLPVGIEVHPVKDEDTRKVWEAANEAFRDHWGYTEPIDEDFISYQGSKYFQPGLWQVAWDGDKIVSSVMNYIDHDYNKKFHRKRGWTENISTLKPWRRRGIARALIVRSMHMHRAKGMNEVGLGVDTNNPNGALNLYQDLGYKKNKTSITYRKPM